jgi:hypothetical protein
LQPDAARCDSVRALQHCARALSLAVLPDAGAALRRLTGRVRLSAARLSISVLYPCQWIWRRRYERWSGGSIPSRGAAGWVVLVPEPAS